MCEQGARVTVVRNDHVDVAHCLGLKPDRVMISPGPGNPSEAGISNDVIKAFAGKVPIFGVCLGALPSSLQPLQTPRATPLSPI